MAQGIDDYCTAAQLYFGYNTDGLSVSSEVLNVNSTLLNGYKGIFEGSMPEGITNRAIQLDLESDTTLRLIIYSDSTIVADDYVFTINGTRVYPMQKADGSYSLDVSGISAKDLDDVQTFTVSYGDVTYTVKASAMTYARASVINGDDARKNLGRALYIYNHAANIYFEN